MISESPRRRRGKPDHFDTETKESVILPPISDSYSRGIPLTRLENIEPSTVKHSVSQPATRRYKKQLLRDDPEKEIGGINKTELILHRPQKQALLSARNPEVTETDRPIKRSNKSNIHLKPLKAISSDPNPKQEKSQVIQKPKPREERKYSKKSDASSSLVLTDRVKSQLENPQKAATPKFVNLKCIDYIPEMKKKLLANSKDLSKPICKKTKEPPKIQTIPQQPKPLKEEPKTIKEEPKATQSKPVVENKPRALFRQDTEINHYINSIKEKVKLLHEKSEEAQI